MHVFLMKKELLGPNNLVFSIQFGCTTVINTRTGDVKYARLNENTKSANSGNFHLLPPGRACPEIPGTVYEFIQARDATKFFVIRRT